MSDPERLDGVIGYLAAHNMGNMAQAVERTIAEIRRLKDELASARECLRMTATEGERRLMDENARLRQEPEEATPPPAAIVIRPGGARPWPGGRFRSGGRFDLFDDPLAAEAFYRSMRAEGREPQAWQVGEWTWHHASPEQPNDGSER